jgi:hypothetical protein
MPNLKVHILNKMIFTVICEIIYNHHVFFIVSKSNVLLSLLTKTNLTDFNAMPSTSYNLIKTFLSFPWTNDSIIAVLRKDDYLDIHIAVHPTLKVHFSMTRLKTFLSQYLPYPWVN